MRYNYVFSNSFTTTNSNYQAIMSLSGIHILQNDTQLKYLKLYADIKTTTSMRINLGMNKTEYFIWVSTHILVKDQQYDNSITFTTYY